jgi:hypothetical protein
MARACLPFATATAVLFASAAAAEAAPLWTDVTEATIGTTAEWSNKVELADLNDDGRVDILFANGGNYNEPGSPEPNRIFLNQGPGMPFREATEEILGATGDTARVIKARDVSGDGIVDILVGTTYQTQSRLYLGTGGGAFREVTESNLPHSPGSVGDLEIGDVDGDGDLDLVLADWGAGDPFESEGAPVRLWLNQGDGRFTDATDRMPAGKVRWSWDLELYDADNDYDLDIAVSCKVCTGSRLYHNDGTGRFTDASDRLPQFTNNYEFEPIDLDGDGFMDLVTINDGDQVSAEDQFDRREHVFMADGQGGYRDGTADVWPAAANVGADDNAVVVLDVDSDGDPDFLIGSLSGTDRLLINQGGRLEVNQEVFGGAATPGTLGIAVADLDGDDRLDVVQSQGELAEDERVYFGTGLEPDGAAPRIDLVESPEAGAAVSIRARVHDNKTPVAAHDFSEVVLCRGECAGGSARAPMSWYGGALWRAEIEVADGDVVQVCATDRAGNASCSEPVAVGDDKTDDPDAGPEEAGGGCAAAGSRDLTGLAGLFLLLAACCAGAVRAKTSACRSSRSSRRLP